MEEVNWIWEDINLLKVDNQNPNVMSKSDKAALRYNIERFGWNMPIITDMTYLIADGEQKLVVAKEMGLTKVPILRKPLTDVERRIVRQSMNKLRGAHDELLDYEEYKRILSATDMQEFVSLTGISEQNIIGLINAANKDNENIKDINKVNQLYHQEVTCPQCGFKFIKEK